MLASCNLTINISELIWDERDFPLHYLTVLKPHVVSILLEFDPVGEPYDNVTLIEEGAFHFRGFQLFRVPEKACSELITDVTQLNLETRGLRQIAHPLA